MFTSWCPSASVRRPHTELLPGEGHSLLRSCRFQPPHPFEEFPCLGRRVRIVLLQCRNSSHLQSPTVITISCLRMRAQCRVLKAPVVTPSSGVAIADRTIAALGGEGANR